VDDGHVRQPEGELVHVLHPRLPVSGHGGQRRADDAVVAAGTTAVGTPRVWPAMLGADFRVAASGRAWRCGRER
jgi:hypothetical protein